MTRALQGARVLGLSFLIFGSIYLSWCVLPVGIDLEPTIHSEATLSPEEVAALTAALRNRGALYQSNAWEQAYRSSFFVPWARRDYRAWVHITPQGTDYRVTGGSLRPAGGEISVEFLAIRKDPGWEFTDERTILSKY